jgi:predicted DNA-binding transcriptional regulator AlpA
MVNKRRPKQVAVALKAAKLKAKANPQPPPQLTRREINGLNRKRQLMAEAYREEQERQEQSKAPRLLTKRQVLARVPVSFVTLWHWMQQGKFPRARKVGGKTCWFESEINAWLEALPLSQVKEKAA